MHFDWMFEVDGVLRTFNAAPFASFDAEIHTDAERLDDHRLAYLEYEGAISGGRGSVCRVITGEYITLRDDERAWQVRIWWRSESDTCQATVSFYRRLSEESRSSDNRPAWRLRFAPCR